ncbi:MAG: hypothetical protein LBR18_05400, partial [Tannerella sp.]|nr:hypothetical protein [Tannerella sp.]
MRTRLAILMFLLAACAGKKDEVAVYVSGGYVVSIDNKYVNVSFNLKNGYYQVFDATDKTLCIDSAFVSFGEMKSTDAGERSWQAVE